jgi:predicted dehydrogenase
MNEVRIGIVGVGIMGSCHARNIKHINHARLTAVCDIDKPKADAIAREVGCKAYYDATTLIESGEIDAVLIATPHYFHTTIGIQALKKGLHVLVEKPISVHKADCQRLIAAHTNKKQVFVAMFMTRTAPLYRKIRQLVSDGELGKLVRVNWILTNWFRTATYYASSDWRATWKGEGGGILLNQLPHNLDQIQWICGMPSRVTGYCSLGKWHDIEVEDEVTAYLEYPNGATGVLVASTGEAPGTNRLEICGERGKLVMENDQLTFIRNEVEMSKFCKTTPELFASPPAWTISIPIGASGNQHNTIIQNFIDAIRNPGTPLIAAAEEGIHSVELANAILYSSMIKKPVDLPLNAEAYERHLKKLIRESGFEKKTRKVSGKVDVAKSFR